MAMDGRSFSYRLFTFSDLLYRGWTNITGLVLSHSNHPLSCSVPKIKMVALPPRQARHRLELQARQLWAILVLHTVGHALRGSHGSVSC